MIAAWPVVVRDRIVHAFKPGGSPAAEGPFRTLRRHEWVSQGVRVTLFADRGLAGQMTFFSSLNVMAARLARRGNAPAAERVARAAADLEAGPEFAILRSLLSELPDALPDHAHRLGASGVTLREGEGHRVHEVSITLELRHVGDVGVNAESVLSIEGQVYLGEVVLRDDSHWLRACGGRARLDEGDQISRNAAHHDLFVVRLVIPRQTPT